MSWTVKAVDTVTGECEPRRDLDDGKVRVSGDAFRSGGGVERLGRFGSEGV